MPRNPDGWGRRPHEWRGRWRAYLTVAYHSDGRPQRAYVYGRTEKECAARLDEARRKHALGVTPSDGSITVRAYLDEWLDQKAREVRRHTVDEYRRELKHALPHVGRLKLGFLGALHIQRMMRAIDGQTVRVGKRDVVLTARAANQARGILANALEDAVQLGLIATNPAKRVRPLRHQARELSIWTADHVGAFLDTCLAGAAAHYALFYLALTTGLRSGELIALEWRDVDGDTLRVQRTLAREGTQRVVGPPKSRASARTVTIPADAIEVLRIQGVALASARIDSRLVFPTRSGGMVAQSNLRKSLLAWAARASVPGLRPHDLRHTYASMAIAAGMSPADLARQLGHTDASFTLRRYVHFFERARPRSAPTLDVLRGARGGTDRGYAPSEPN